MNTVTPPKMLAKSFAAMAMAKPQCQRQPAAPLVPASVEMMQDPHEGAQRFEG